METVIHLMIWGLSIAVGVVAVADYLRGRVEALSLRNVSLLGFLIFMVWSAHVGLRFDPNSSYMLADPTGTVFKWLLWCALFLLLYLIAYRMGFGSKAIARILPAPTATIGPVSAWPLIAMLTGLGLLLKIVPIPLIGVLTTMTAVGLASVSAGIAGWVWGPRLFNPVFALLGGVTVLANAYVANYGEFGRRPLVSVGACLIWGMYYSSFRTMRLPSMAGRIALVAIPPMILFGLYSSVRSWDTIGTTAVVTEMFTQGDATQSLREVGEQDTARIGQWLMEYTERGAYETRPLFSIAYFFMYPIPRDFFGVLGYEKPYPISTQMADLSNRQGVKRGATGVTNPAGIVGNTFAEGGLIAIVAYAIAGAFIFRLGDEFVRRNVSSAFLVLPVGASLGQVLGIPRGESSVFMFHFVWTSISVTVLMLMASAVITRVFPQLVAADQNTLDSEAAASEWSASESYYESYEDYDEAYASR